MSVSDSKQALLVSILCRSVNHPALPQALRAIAAQDYPNLEVVLVDAGAKGLDLPDDLPENLTLRLVRSPKPLDRPQAANMALQHARGRLLMFLDEDDWIANNHVSGLVAVMQAQPQCEVVYSATRCVSGDGQLLAQTIAVEWDADLLKRDNFIPIHAALFTRRLVNQGCHFDEGLPIYEDWDFWLQCARKTDFLHVPQLSAFYRLGGASNTAQIDYRERYRSGSDIARARARLLDKWRKIWSGEELNRLLGIIDQADRMQAMDEELGQLHQRLANREQSLAQSRQQLQQLQQSQRQLQQHLTQLQGAHLQLQQAHQQLDAGVREILNSFSWRVTAPYRWGRRRLVRGVQNLRSKLPTALANWRPPLPTTGAAGRDLPRGAILMPGTQHKLCHEHFTVQCWGWSPQGLSRAALYLNEQLLTELPVAQMRCDDEADAQRVGVAHPLANIDPDTGSSTLRLLLEDDAGNRRELQQPLILISRDAHYRQWRQRCPVAAPDVAPASRSGIAVVIDDAADATSLAASMDSLAAQHWRQFRSLLLSRRDHNPDDLQQWQSQLPALDLAETLIPWLQARASDCDYVLFLQAGETLDPFALLHWMQAAEQQSAGSRPALLYSDHDQVNEAGTHQNAWFTPAWSPALLRSCDYIGAVWLLALTQLETDTAEHTALLEQRRPDWRYQLLLQLARPHWPVQRVPQILWSAPAQQQQQDATHGTVTAATQASGRVSIIIPTTGNPRWLKPCLDGLRQHTDWPDMEIIVLDNSRGQHAEGIAYAQTRADRVIVCDEAFNWARFNNIGAAEASGDYLLFLNDDIEVVSADWLRALVVEAAAEDVGTVGALLLYPNGAIQHAGVFLVDHGGGARHLFYRQLPGEGIYQQLHQHVREVSANTGACLLMSRQRFDELQGFDESLALIGNDIDLCLRCLQAGWRNVWTPHSRLLHHESVSRRDRPIGADEQLMWQRWGSLFEAGDPYLSPHFDLHREDCVLVLPALAAHPASTALAPGVNMVAYIRAEMGVGQAARGNAAALSAAGIDFCILNYEQGNPSRMTELSWSHREVDSGRYNINLIHINADHIQSVMHNLADALPAQGYNIGFWAWELPEFPDRWLDAFAGLDEVWVPSDFVNRAVAEKSPLPVITIPHAITITALSAPEPDRNSLDISTDCFVFLTMFDTHSIAQRKNPFGAIRAFQRAFAADDQRALLLIKVNNADQEALDSLQPLLQSQPNIRIIDQPMTRDQVDSLLQLSDCLVSLHHAEGFGLGPAEAMALGKVALLTNWSGNTEYMDADCCVPIRYTLRKLDADYGPYEAHQHWAVADIEHAAAEMRELVHNPVRARQLGQRAQEQIQKHFSAAAIGERMQRRFNAIQRIIRQRNP